MLQAHALSELPGFRDIMLWVLETNERVRRFYERTGFRRDGTIKIEYREGFELRELRYHRSLDGSTGEHANDETSHRA